LEQSAHAPHAQQAGRFRDFVQEWCCLKRVAGDRDIKEGGTDPMLSRWMLVILFGLEAHFAASYLVPLDERSGREFGGLIRWFSP